MAAVTRLGLYGGSRAPYGSFAGKAAAPLTGPHTPGHITRLGLYGGARAPYGSFAGKAEAAPQAAPRRRGGGYPYPTKGRKAYVQRREEDRAAVLATIKAAYSAAVGELPEMPSEAVSAVREAANKAAPPSARRKRVLPPAKAVNFEVLAKQAGAVDALLDWYEQAQEDEMVAILLLAA